MNITTYSAQQGINTVDDAPGITHKDGVILYRSFVREVQQVGDPNRVIVATGLDACCTRASLVDTLAPPATVTVSKQGIIDSVGVKSGQDVVLPSSRPYYISADFAGIDRLYLLPGSANPRLVCALQLMLGSVRLTDLRVYSRQSVRVSGRDALCVMGTYKNSGSQKRYATIQGGFSSLLLIPLCDVGVIINGETTYTTKPGEATYVQCDSPEDSATLQIAIPKESLVVVVGYTFPL